MASEHTHEWDTRLTFLDCIHCGARIRYDHLGDLLGVEQQLAQAKEEIERLQSADYVQVERSKLEELAMQFAEMDTENERLKGVVDRTIERVREMRAERDQAQEENAQARVLLKEELPYEERTGGYHAEEWSARARAFLAQHKE